MREISKFEVEVKIELLKRKITITSLANKLGISVAYCSDVIRGNRSAIHIRKKICEELNISIKEVE
jgi:DNA-binding Xre family transcriptional regulator